ncbi:MAG: hypothetical protein LBU22_09835 [Dysgonamonadaceae bacterium]|nr:hypothetical protein [Dysgonamonadaceae bacterium]
MRRKKFNQKVFLLKLSPSGDNINGKCTNVERSGTGVLLPPFLPKLASEWTARE